MKGDQQCQTQEGSLAHRTLGHPSVSLLWEEGTKLSLSGLYVPSVNPALYLGSSIIQVSAGEAPPLLMGTRFQCISASFSCHPDICLVGLLITAFYYIYTA